MAGGDLKKLVPTNLFKIGISGLDTSHVISVSGFNVNFEEIRELALSEQGTPEHGRLPSIGPVWAEITITRALSRDMTYYDWWKTNPEGTVMDSMKEGTITVLDPAMKELVTWEFSQAWPTKYSVPGYDAGNRTEVAKETLTLAAEFKRTS